MLVEEGDSIYKYLWRVSLSESNFVRLLSQDESSQEKIAYFLTQQAVNLLVHFKFLRVYQMWITVTVILIQ